MSDLVDPADVERIVGVRRQVVAHVGRFVTAEGRVYILHSVLCRGWHDKGVQDLRDCPVSRALDAGLIREWWDGFEDAPTLLSVENDRLMPTWKLGETA